MKPNYKTVRDAIRASVPDGKIKGAKITLKEDTKGMPIGGFTEYDQKDRKQVIRIGAPASDNAFGITVRGHETRHATRHKPARKKPLTEMELIAGQIVDDANIESTELPRMDGMEQYKRQHLAVAYGDLHSIIRNVRAVRLKRIPDSVKLRNGNLMAAVRIMAMLRNYGEGISGVKSAGIIMLRNAIGDRAQKAAGVVAKLAISSRQRAKAVSMLLALLEKEETEAEEIDGDRVRDGDILSPVVEGDALDGKMNLIDLRPKSVYCAKEKRITRRNAPSGVIINSERFVQAIVSNDASGLFSRRVKKKSGGCVVIDASGSMGATAKNLAQLCALVPTATVGYYSGTAAGRGNLCVYADKEKRFSGNLPEEYMHGGNSVDLPALRWCLKHPKPWVLVSDLQFCGGVLGSEQVAQAIVEREVKRGNLKVYRSLDEAYTAFGGKGLLKN